MNLTVDLSSFSLPQSPFWHAKHNPDKYLLLFDPIRPRAKILFITVIVYHMTKPRTNKVKARGLVSGLWLRPNCCFFYGSGFKSSYVLSSEVCFFTVIVILIFYLTDSWSNGKFSKYNWSRVKGLKIVALHNSSSFNTFRRRDCAAAAAAPHSVHRWHWCGSS